MNARITRLYTYMDEHEIDLLLITEPKHVYYLTGFSANPRERFLGLVLQKQQEPFLLVPALELQKAMENSSVTRIYTHTDEDHPYLVLKSLLPGRLQRVGIEKRHVHVAAFEELSEVINSEKYVDIGQQIIAMRLIKDVHEIARLKRAASLVADVLQAGLSAVKVGATELEVVSELEYQMRKLGADGPAFTTKVLSGVKSAMPHGYPGTRKIRSGELLLFDLGVLCDGYVSDITRTFAVGDVDNRIAEIYETVLQANLSGIEAVRPKVTAASVDRIARDVIVQKGYGKFFLHRTGHGLGMDLHEGPYIHGKNEEVLQEGMVFTVEPGIYVPDVGGVRIEDDVLVTSEGVEVLTASFSKELRIIG